LWSVAGDRGCDRRKFARSRCSGWIGSDYTIPITATDYRDARKAKELLLAALALEESYDIVVLNYEAFETANFSAKIVTVLDRRRERHEIEGVRRELDRHLVKRTMGRTWLESTALEFDYASQVDSLRRKNSALISLRRLEILD
jgi:hypothetical protein